MTKVTLQALDNSYKEERRKRCIFRWLRNAGRDDADVMWHGRSFQVLAAATGKAREKAEYEGERGGLEVFSQAGVSK